MFALSLFHRLPGFGLGLVVLLWGAMAALPARASDVTLYMIEQHGCIYCMTWDREVGDAYHLTAEGRAAPLTRLDLRAAVPEGVSFARKPQFTPTFILVRDGQELSRIEGYPGEDFFWGMLGVMLKDADAPFEAIQ
jgi:hypothetical protein